MSGESEFCFAADLPVSRQSAAFLHSKQTGHPWPVAVGPPVRPWTRPQFRGLFSVVPDRIGFPTDMDCIGPLKPRLQRFLRASGKLSRGSVFSTLPTGWITLRTACQGIGSTTISFLDAASKRRVSDSLKTRSGTVQSGPKRSRYISWRAASPARERGWSTRRLIAIDLSS